LTRGQFSRRGGLTAIGGSLTALGLLGGSFGFTCEFVLLNQRSVQVKY
jgi:hypothetical protein